MVAVIEVGAPMAANRQDVPDGFVWNASNRGTAGRTTSPAAYYPRMCAAKAEPHRSLPEDQVALVAEVFRMLADGTRIRILWALIDTELSVNEIAAQVGKSGPAVSQHLAKLRMARLVRTRRDGNQIFYQLENDHIQQLLIDGVYNAEHAGHAVPPHHRDAAIALPRPIAAATRGQD